MDGSLSCVYIIDSATTTLEDVDTPAAAHMTGGELCTFTGHISAGEGVHVAGCRTVVFEGAHVTGDVEVADCDTLTVTDAQFDDALSIVDCQEARFSGVSVLGDFSFEDVTTCSSNPPFVGCPAP